jgi:hypothetical protein
MPGLADLSMLATNGGLFSTAPHRELSTRGRGIIVGQDAIMVPVFGLLRTKRTL